MTASDLQVEIVPVDFEKLSDARPSESSERIRERVLAAREIQTRRFAPYPEVHCNAQMTPRLMQLFARPMPKGWRSSVSPWSDWICRHVPTTASSR